MDIVSKLLAARLIARQWEERGYVVTIEPPAAAIPAAFDGYHPELLAVKGDERLMIDVKSPGARTDQDFYQRLTQKVQALPGWRLLMASVSREELHTDAMTDRSDVSEGELRNQLHGIHNLFHDARMAVFLLPRLWTIYIAALRLLAAAEETDMCIWNDLSVINNAYSAGLVAWNEHEDARRLLTLRNSAVVALDNQVTLADCQRLHHMATHVLDELPAACARAGVLQP